MRTLSETEVNALINLLSDRSDPHVHGELIGQLRDMDEISLRTLRLAAKRADDFVVMDIERLLHARVWDQLVSEIKAANGNLPLLDYLILLARFGHLDCDVGTIRKTMDRLAAASTKGPGAPYDRIRRTLGHEWEFHGNEEDYYTPENSYIDSILRTRQGIPISLSALYILVGARLEEPIHGVGLPGHFIIGHFPDDASPTFYDPFRGGVELPLADCRDLVERNGMPFQTSFLEPVSPRYIFLRMCNNLLQIYTRQNQADRCHILRQLIDTVAH